ncbi:MAG: malonyl CoA-acyl carrier protein transacylase, partial [Alphaproteobacteria bacterium]|nr:malonyl CoA-acyl carrier protein transacylase [Alphaproteobacteria bacterium]
LAPAADVMAEALAEVEVGKPRTPLVANVTAVAVTDPEEIRSLLVEQVTARVRWREVVVFMRSAEVDTQVELGAGKVLSGLARRIDRDLARIAVGAPEDVDAFVESL